MHVIWAIIAFVIVLSVVVFVHELGHFLAARWAGVRVNKFSVGFGPAIVKWHDKHGTQWQIACIPLGGYVSIYGQEDMFDRKKYDALSREKKRGHYLSVTPWKQFIIIAAGVTMNFILAWFIYSATFMFHPQQVQLPIIGQVIRNSTAFKAGVKPGDTILQIDNEKVTNWGEILIAKELASAHDADVLVARGKNIVHVKLAPTEEWGLVADGSKTEFRKKGFFGAIYSGARNTYKESKLVLTVLKQVVTGERSNKDLGSLITIAQISGEKMAIGFFALMTFIARLSVNLAIINLLPLPVLDGGYLLILAVEAVIRRKLTGKWMEIVIMFGWVLIFAIFLLTMWNDLARVFGLM